MNPPARALRLSASSLARFETCHRMFYLQDIQGLRWPRPKSRPNDTSMQALQDGQRFHQLIEQAAQGVDPGPALEALDNPRLARWWRDFVTHSPPPTGKVFSEIALTAPLAGHWLFARLDRVELDPAGVFVISDWKTGRSKLNPETLAESWQTCLYRYLLVEAGRNINEGREVDASAIVMRYWHADWPESPIELAYDEDQHEASRERLRLTISEIEALRKSGEQSAFPKTSHAGLCQRCRFQVYCGRGPTKAEEDIASADLDITFADLPFGNEEASQDGSDAQEVQDESAEVL